MLLHLNFKFQYTSLTRNFQTYVPNKYIAALYAVKMSTTEAG